MIYNWSQLQIFTFFFVLLRVISILFFLPLLGDKAVPETVRILFGVALTFVVFPLAWSFGARIDPTILDSPLRLMWAVGCEIAFGTAVGFASRWLFDAVQFAGHYASTSIGYSIASVVDPHTESHTTAYGELHYILVAILFLAMNGPHIYLSAIFDSLREVHVGAIMFDPATVGRTLADELVKLSSEILILALKLSAPVVVTILLVNLSFGVIARAVPQMNVIAVSFATNILVGLFIGFSSLPGFINLVGSTMESYQQELQAILRIFHG